MAAVVGCLTDAVKLSNIDYDGDDSVDVGDGNDVGSDVDVDDVCYSYYCYLY